MFEADAVTDAAAVAATFAVAADGASVVAVEENEQYPCFLCPELQVQ